MTPANDAHACCSIGDCDRPARKRGWCETHYSRWRRTGSLDRTTPERPPAECGSYGGYQRHISRGDEPCTPCREANRGYHQEYRRSAGEPGKTKERKANRARTRALWRLAREYPERYREFVAEESAALESPGGTA